MKARWAYYYYKKSRRPTHYWVYMCIHSRISLAFDFFPLGLLSDVWHARACLFIEDGMVHVRWGNCCCWAAVYYIILSCCISFQQTHTRDVCVHIFSSLGWGFVAARLLSIFFVLILLFLFLITLHFLSSFFRAPAGSASRGFRYRRSRRHPAAKHFPLGSVYIYVLHQSFGFQHAGTALWLSAQGRDLIWLYIHYIKADDAPPYYYIQRRNITRPKKKKQFCRPSRRRLVLLLYTGRNINICIRKTSPATFPVVSFLPSWNV